MNYTSYKKDARKVALWMGSSAISAIVIGLVCIFCISFNKKMQVAFALELCLDILLMYFLFLIMTLNRVFFRGFITPIHIGYTDESESLEFKLSALIHFIVFALSSVSFFLVITCYSSALEISWTKAALKTLPLNIVLLFWNYIFLYFYTHIFLYKLNQNEHFKAEMLTFINQSKVMPNDKENETSQ